MQCVLQHAGENSAYGLGQCLMASPAQSAGAGHQLRNPSKAGFANTSFQGEMVLAASGLFLGGLKSGSVQAPLGAVAEIWGECSLAAMAPWHLELAVFHCCWRSPGGVSGLCGASVEHRSCCLPLLQTGQLCFGPSHLHWCRWEGSCSSTAVELPVNANLSSFLTGTRCVLSPSQCWCAVKALCAPCRNSL